MIIIQLYRSIGSSVEEREREREIDGGRERELDD
jgi:hypothetical protein